jgi:hypothetical protein
MAGEPGNRSQIALDELEKALLEVDRSPRRPAAEDPLAELARLVGHEDPFKPVGGGARFDDVLAGGRPAAQAPAPGPILPVYPPEAQVTQPVAQPAPVHDDPASIALAEMVERAMVEAHTANLSTTTAALPADVAQLDPLELAGLMPASEPEQHPRPVHEDRMFEQMLAELEAQARHAAAPAVPFATDPVEPATAIPPPPPRPAASVGIEEAMAGLAAAAAARTVVQPRQPVEVEPLPEPVAVSPLEPEPPKGRRGMMMAGAVIGIAVIGVGALLAFGRKPDQPRVPGNGAPVIAAAPGAVKERPANPGGVDVPNQDKAIFQQRQEPARSPERVAPREEQPVDLSQAQRAVRQIPGVPVVAAPAVPQPPPAQTATVDPTPTATAPPVRQVQGIPIVLSPPPAPVPAPPPAPVQASPPPAQVSVTPSVTVSPPPARVEAPPPPAPARVEPAAPRRVQSVPVRSETAETPRPRPAPAQPVRRPVEEPQSNDPNAPLRITPPALRGTSTPQRVASAPSAPAAPSEATQRINPDTGGGGGFTVQLSAEGSEDAAQARFARMRSQYGDVLGGASPSVRRAEVGGRSVYRLRVGNMSREEANSLCERLKASGGSCFVARN